MGPPLNGSEFYVGYQPRAPRGLGRFSTRTAVVLLLAAAGVALWLSSAMEQFDAGSFSYLDYQPRRGILMLRPYPRLDGRWLVAPGKHAFDPASPGGAAELQGALIANPQQSMFEVLPGSLRSGGPSPPPTAEDRNLGMVTVTGEIVDTKCYFGVMKPGRGHVHRACAARCLSGGIPAGLLVRDARGEARVVMLASEDGDSIARELSPLAGDRVTVRGRLIRSAGSLILEAPVKSFRRE